MFARAGAGRARGWGSPLSDQQDGRVCRRRRCRCRCHCRCRCRCRCRQRRRQQKQTLKHHPHLDNILLWEICPITLIIEHFKLIDTHRVSCYQLTSPWIRHFITSPNAFFLVLAQLINITKKTSFNDITISDSCRSLHFQTRLKSLHSSNNITKKLVSQITFPKNNTPIHSHHQLSLTQFVKIT